MLTCEHGPVPGPRVVRRIAVRRGIDGRSMSNSTQCIEDGSEPDEAGEDAVKSFRPPDFVASVAHPSSHTRRRSPIPGGGTIGPNLGPRRAGPPGRRGHPHRHARPPPDHGPPRPGGGTPLMGYGHTALLRRSSAVGGRDTRLPCGCAPSARPCVRVGLGGRTPGGSERARRERPDAARKGELVGAPDGRSGLSGRSGCGG